ncbi:MULTISPECIES: DUF4254 domain-containing protein [unclassified Nocardia]|uniref:DUF4254 domain-containing protein n=2 Tax=Nocardia TaxID=1817 RepID=UPI00278BEA3E|nr:MULTISPECIES: DUF4254 domain-containing protein [unclassified Nocardia]
MFPRERAVAVAAREPLPRWQELLAAFGGADTDRGTGHPLLDAAAALAELHRLRRSQPGHAAEIDCRRAELAAVIDGWVSVEPQSHRPRSESVGGFVDRMAAAHAHADRLLHSDIDIADDRVHAAWHRLAALADAWTDLTGQDTVTRR